MLQTRIATRNRSRRPVVVAAVMLSVGLLAAQANAAVYLYTGGGVDTLWATNANWDGGTAPTNPNTDVMQFDGNSGGASSIATDWQVGQVKLDVWDSGGNYTHTLDLGGKVLTTETGIYASEWKGPKVGSDLAIQNGTLQLGTASSPASITLGQYHHSAALKFVSGGGGKVHTVNLSSINLAAYGSSYGAAIDLRNAEVVGGVFEVGDLTLNHKGSFRQDSTTVMSKLYVKDDFRMVGSGPSFSPLAAGVDLQVGQDSTNVGTLVLTSGGTIGANAGSGTFTAYLDKMTVGGTLDMSGMAGVMIDASDADGFIGDSVEAKKNGTVRLGDGTATFKSLLIGEGGKTGLLELFGTDLTVNETLDIGSTGSVNITDGGSITVLTELILGGTSYAPGTYDSTSDPDYISGTGSITLVPEPGTLALVAVGGLGALLRRRRA